MSQYKQERKQADDLLWEVGKLFNHLFCCVLITMRGSTHENAIVLYFLIYRALFLYINNY